MSSIMKSELERLAELAVGHGLDDPAIDVFLVFVGALDPLPAAATLQPAAKRIGKLRLAQALDRPGEVRLGACRLLAAASAEPPRSVAPPLSRPGARLEGNEQAVADVAPSGGLGRPEPFRRLPGTATLERPVETGRRLPELFEALLHAIRVALHSVR